MRTFIPGSRTCRAILASGLLVATATNLRAGDVEQALSALQAELEVTGYVNNAHFGTCAAIDGSRAAVGGPGPAGGAVWLFEKRDGLWELDSKIVPDDGHPGQSFGSAVVLEDDLLVVGARSDDQAAPRGGSVYIYRPGTESGSWELEQKLVPPSPEHEGHFGRSLSYDDGWLLIGAPGENVTGINSGAAYVYAHIGGLWQDYIRFTPQTAETHQYFGHTVAVEDGIAVIGAPGTADDIGAVSVYVRENNSWNNLRQTLQIQFGGEFGRCVALEMPWLAIGGPSTTLGAEELGAASLYRFNGSVFAHEQTFVGSGGTEYGTAVGLTVAPGDTPPEMLVGAPLHHDERGRVHRIRSTGPSTWGEFGYFGGPQYTPGTRFGTLIAASSSDLLLGSRWGFIGGRRTGSLNGYGRGSDGWDYAGVLGPLDAGLHDKLGTSVAIAGDLAVVGAPGEDDGVHQGGAAYVFERSDGEWSPSGRLTAGVHIENGANFGASVATDGELVVVGAPYEDAGASDSGALYVYSRTLTGTWATGQRLVPSDPSPFARFGHDVAVHSDRVVAGAPSANGNAVYSGALYSFTRSTIGFWTQDAKITAAETDTNDHFGSRVAFDGQTLVAGAISSGEETRGLAVVFELTNGSWSVGTQLRGLDLPLERFGLDVAVDGDLLAISAQGSMSGSKVHVYERDASGWQQINEISSPSLPSGIFGFSIGLSGNTLLVGRAFTDTRVHAFQRTGSLWEHTEIVLPDAADADDFGWSVSVDGDSLLVGAPGRGPGDEGAALVYSLSTPSPFQPFGFGDGSVRPCPCDNDSLPGADEGCVNSSGIGARLRATGSASLSADDMVVSADQIPPGRSTQLFIGENRLIGLPFGDGLRIATVPFIRIALQQSSASGSVTWTGLHATDFWAAGDTRFFQAFYRDPGGPCESGFNVTNALQVIFAP